MLLENNKYYEKHYLPNFYCIINDFYSSILIYLAIFWYFDKLSIVVYCNRYGLTI